jgi:thioredoxin-like negative regulator of GroEL
MVFKNGAAVATKVGALPKRQLQDWIEQSVA